MNPADSPIEAATRRGLLVDTNLLVLLTVGSVNRNRIQKFKRTSQYCAEDFDLLLHVLGAFQPLYTVAHVMAEVGNLTDLWGVEGLQARWFLRESLALLKEPSMPSVRAAQVPTYERLGLVDAAIVAVAREHKCSVHTDDLDHYLTLSDEDLPVVNFTH